ncbi:MAG: tetratricopeptide repeat protein [Trueperaceae bacterium]|nr:MAG: tetratricopeptide repeat protein [Trueperaceae bacterium]
MRSSILPLIVVALCWLATAGAQTYQRIVILPFESNQAIGNTGIGLSAALQRSLNNVDFVYVPPVADAGLFFQRAVAAGYDPIPTTLDAFQAEALVGGEVSGVGSGTSLTITFVAAGTGEPRRFRIPPAPGELAQLASVAARVVVTELNLNMSRTDQQEVQRAIEQIPSSPGLNAVALPSARLPTSNLQELEAAAELDSDSSWVLSEYARALSTVGRTSQAVAASERAVTALPTDVEAWVVRGAVLARTGDLTEAAKAFEHALTLNPGHALALAGLASIQDGDRAKELLEEALLAYPRMSEAYIGLARIEKSDQRSLNVLRRGAELIPDSVPLHRAILETTLKLGDPMGAIAYLTEVTSHPLSTSPSLYSLAASLPQEVAPEALDIIQKGKVRYPGSLILGLAEADLHRKAGDVAAVEGVLRPLFEAYPQDVRLGTELALAQAKLGKVSEAAATYSSVVAMSLTGQLNLAGLFLEAGRPEAALVVLEPLQSELPADAEVLTYYGIALGRTGRLADALEAFDAALARSPGFELASRAQTLLLQQQELVGRSIPNLNAEAAVAFQQGLYYLERGNQAAAATALEHAVAFSDDPVVAFYQAYALQLSGKPSEALVAYQRVLERFPESETVLNNLGFTQVQLGLFEEGVSTLERAVALRPESAQAHLNLGLAYFRLERYREALDQWDETVRIDPSLESTVDELRRAAAGKTSP